MELRLLRTAVAIAMVTATFVHTDAGSAVAESHDRPAYRVDELASLGGLASAGASINDRGWVAGSSDLPGDASAHATLWRDGTLTDLRTLGGPNSAVAWPVKNDRIVVGVSETATIGREGEDWSCSAFFPGEPTHHDCVGFVWRDGRMAALPTLGGPNGYAAGANRRGEVVGWAETGQRDPTCISPQVEQFLAVRWDASSASLRLSSTGSPFPVQASRFVCSARSRDRAVSCCNRPTPSSAPRSTTPSSRSRSMRRACGSGSRCCCR